MSEKQQEMVLLDDEQRKHALVLMQQHKSLAESLTKYTDVYGQALDALRNVIGELRAANLAPVDITLVLRHAGWSESRASEVKQIVLSPDDVFDKYMKRIVGFRLALKEARSAISGPTQDALPPRVLQLLVHAIEQAPTMAAPRRPWKGHFVTRGLRCEIKIKQAKFPHAPKNAAKKKGKK